VRRNPASFPAGLFLSQRESYILTFTFAKRKQSLESDERSRGTADIVLPDYSRRELPY
jgi:hypothetical protein